VPHGSLTAQSRDRPAALHSVLSRLEVFDGRIEIDTNLVENAIRPTKLGAKNWLFIGCREAGQRAAILYTVVENCRPLDIDTREYPEECSTHSHFH
jgi:hypothetical protein